MGSKPSGGGSGGGGGNNEDKKIYGMGPGQSMAMAGNTGLASFTENDINKVQQAKKDYNKFTGNNNQNTSFTNIGQEIGELGSKYRRPVKIADGLGPYSDGSGRRYNPNDFDSQGNFRTFTASKPTFAQVMGDVGRAFTGYNSINYDQPGVSNSPISMVDTPGLIEQGIFSPGLTIGKALLNAIPSFKNQTQENLQKTSMGEGSLTRNDLLDNYIKKGMGLGNAPGGIEPLGLPVSGDITIEEETTRPVYNFQDPIYPAELIQQDALNRFPGNDFQIKLKPKPPVPNIYESTGASAGSPFDTGTPLPLMEEKDPNILDKFLNLFQGGSNEVSNILGTNQGNDGGSSGGGGESSEPDVPPAFDPNDPFANLDPQYLKLLEAFQSAGGGNLYSQQDIVDYFRKMKYLAYGGSVAPQSGPMSNGIGTLYNTR